MQRAERIPFGTQTSARPTRTPIDFPNIGFVVALVLGLAVIFVLSLVLYTPTDDLRAGADTYNLIGGLLVAVLIISISLPMLRREALRQNDRKLFALLALAFMLKIAGSLLRHYTIFDVFSGSDAVGYHGNGLRIMDSFRDGNFDPGLDGYTDTDFIRLLTGLIYTVIGPTSYGGFLIYSWLAFWGLFLCYRAFVIAVPDGRSRSYAHLLFFFPSMLFWPSSIGKEAWMLFAIGIAAFGAARVLSGHALRGLPLAALGLWLGALIRPHVPGMLGAALLVGFLVGRRHEQFRPTKPIIRIATLAVLLAGAGILITQTQEFLKSDILSVQGLTSTLEQNAERSDHGGSEFSPPIVRTPLDIPAAFVTVMYRPFVFEANNALAMVSAVEGAWLLLFSLKRWRWAVEAFKKLRQQPFIALAIVYVFVFVIAFSSLPNFGLLARQRVQVYPFFFLLLCIPYLKEKAPQTPLSRFTHST
jgi:hypothetical protein